MVKVKKLRDPYAPKPPLNAYMEFCKQERVKVRSECQGFTIKEVVKEIGVKWKKLQQEEKYKYERLFQENKTRHFEAVKQYRARAKSNDVESGKEPLVIDQNVENPISLILASE